MAGLFFCTGNLPWRASNEGVKLGERSAGSRCRTCGLNTNQVNRWRTRSAAFKFWFWSTANELAWRISLKQQKWVWGLGTDCQWRAGLGTVFKLLHFRNYERRSKFWLQSTYIAHAGECCNTLWAPLWWYELFAISTLMPWSMFMTYAMSQTTTKWKTQLAFTLKSL